MSERTRESICVACRHKQSNHFMGIGKCTCMRSTGGGNVSRCSCGLFVAPSIAQTKTPETP